MAKWLDDIGLEPKDWLTILLLLVAVVTHWATFQARVSALEEAVKPVPQIRIDTEIVKQAILDIRDDLKDLKHRG